MEDILSLVLAPVKWLAWVAALPVKVFTWIVVQLKPPYDPETVTCPGCGFAGDDGTGGKSCKIRHVRVDSAHIAMNRHECFRCSATFYTKLFTPAKDWIK